METLTIATRGGKLALAQTKIVADALRSCCPDVRIEIKTVTTRGDRDRRTPLWNLKETGFFTTQVEDVLLADEADIAVHSFKDLPTFARRGLTIAAVCDRRFVEDCLVAVKPVASIEELAPAAKIGTCSLRRIAQLKHLRADLQPVSTRGNVTTRIKKLAEGEYDAIILARAGVERLGLSDKISFCFDPKKFIPAAAQGVLAVQIRSDDARVRELVTEIDNRTARVTALAERGVLTTLQCGCHAPVGVFAEIVGENINIYAFISDLEGRNFINRSVTGWISDADKLAEELAGDLLSAGGENILQNI